MTFHTKETGQVFSKHSHSHFLLQSATHFTHTEKQKHTPVLPKQRPHFCCCTCKHTHMDSESCMCVNTEILLSLLGLYASLSTLFTPLTTHVAAWLITICPPHYITSYLHRPVCRPSLPGCSCRSPDWTRRADWNYSLFIETEKVVAVKGKTSCSCNFHPPSYSPRPSSQVYATIKSITSLCSWMACCMLPGWSNPCSSNAEHCVDVIHDLMGGEVLSNTLWGCGCLQRCVFRLLGNIFFFFSLNVAHSLYIVTVQRLHHKPCQL